MLTDQVAKTIGSKRIRDGVRGGKGTQINPAFIRELCIDLASLSFIYVKGEIKISIVKFSREDEPGH